MSRTKPCVTCGAPSPATAAVPAEYHRCLPCVVKAPSYTAPRPRRPE